MGLCFGKGWVLVKFVGNFELMPKPTQKISMLTKLSAEVKTKLHATNLAMLKREQI